MTDREIVKSYQEALDKRRQVGILAELNAVKKEEIIELLERNGISDLRHPSKPERAGGKAPQFRWTPEKEERLRQLQAEGRTSLEASLAIGCTRGSVLHKAHELGIVMNRPEGKKPRPGRKAPSPTSREETAQKVEPPREAAARPRKTPHALLDEIAASLEAVSAELVRDPKSPRGWRLFGQAQALVAVLRDKEESA